MVEGHQCHRVAAAHRKLLVGHPFKASSPNGRFVDGAAAVDNLPLSKIEVHGKNLFYFFARRTCSEKVNADAPEAGAAELQAQPSAHEVVHVHFGMSGAFKTMNPPGDEPTATTRLRLESKALNIIAHLSAMTVNHGDDAYYQEKIQSLGPDPLREDADCERLWSSVQTCKKPIGLVLMDQALVAGLGNIYRAEVLFKAKVHPEQPANSITRAEFDEIWKHSVLLLQRGFQTGSILTVDEEDAQRMGKPWTRRYIYNHTHCGMCKGRVRTWDMATRTVYACETCQVLRGREALPKARRDAMAAAADAKEFVSHCAAEGGDTVTPEKMTIAQLRAALLKLDTKPPSPARKPDLVAALLAAQRAAAPPAAVEAAGAAVAAAEGSPAVKPEGTEMQATDTAVKQEHDQEDPMCSVVASGASTQSQVVLDSKPPGTPKRGRNQLPTPEKTPDSKVTKRRRYGANGTAAAAGAPGAGDQKPGDTQEGEQGGELDDKHPAAPAGSLSEAMLKFMKVPELKAELKRRSVAFSSRASKAALLQLLSGSLVSDATGHNVLEASEAAGAAMTQNESTVEESRKAKVVPGTQGLLVATAAAAAEEKVAAGENRAVEHVALGDGDVAGNLL